MCGICGTFGAVRETEATQAILSGMTRCLAHRGPDGEGFFVEEAVGFGHRRLSIIDIEGGIQPMHSEDGRYVLSFCGEIYNYLELRQGLIQQGERFRTFSDTEVLLKLLIRHGAEALQQLIGMFAFSFYDRSTRRWLLAVDPFGVKPLYYAQLPGELVFASEIKALLKHPNVADLFPLVRKVP